MQSKKFEQIDALRFFAVLPVLISHWCLFNINESLQFLLASNGVNLFFAISGFLITLGLLRAKEKAQTIQSSLWKFYMRRFLRIFPIYYLMLFLLWFLNHKKVADGIWWYLSYMTNFYCIKIQDWGGVSHLWSLAIEEQFYLAWPFIILFTPKRFLPSLIGISILTSLVFKTYCVYTGATFWVYYMNPIAVLDILSIGALLSYYYNSNTDQLKNILYNPLIGIITIVQFVFILYLKTNDRFAFIYLVLNRFSFGLFSAWLIGRTVFGFDGVIGYILNSSPIRYIGKISYGVYLYHILIPGMLMGLKYPQSPPLRFCLYFVVTIAISAISWHYFESKILKFKDKFE